MGKKVTLAFILVVFNIIIFFTINASAEIYENLTYIITDGEVTITDCDVNATEVVIPDKIEDYPVTCVEKFAFQNCTKLASITIPESMKEIGDCAFANCNSLINVYISNMTNWCNIDFYIMASNPLCYAENLYLNGELVEILEIPSGVTEIGNFTFVDYDRLTSVTLPYGVKRIGDATFNCCDELVNINIPDSVESIGNSAFLGCTNLNSIVLPNSVTDISISAFRKCSSLTDVILSDSITNIPMRMFGGCTSLTKLTIPEGVEIIGRCAFEDCTNLLDITIPYTVTSIYYNAFANCNNLEEVRYNGTESEWNSIIIGTGNSTLNFSDIVYIARTKTIISEDRKTFTVNPFNVKEKNIVILALYEGNRFIEMQSAIYKGNVIPFQTTLNYTMAKVMVWENTENLKPICNVEIVK